MSFEVAVRVDRFSKLNEGHHKLNSTTVFEHWKLVEDKKSMNVFTANKSGE